MNRKLGLLVSFSMIILNGFIVMAISIGYNLPMSVFFSNVYADLLYVKPWSRFGTYFCGIVLGMMYFEHKSVEKYPAMKNSFGNWYFTKLGES